MSKSSYFDINKHIAGACHMAFWAFLFFSPLTFWRGMGITLPHYLMICMQPLTTLFVFYLNYVVLAPKLFVAGKHRYDLLINIVLVLVLGIFLHHWMNMTNEIFMPGFKANYGVINTFSYILRDSLNLGIFAGGATALALARRWVTTDQKLKATEAARAKAELSNLRNQINPHFLLNTLNNIYALTTFDPAKAQEAIQELSKMLRHILYDYQRPTVTLKDEIEFLQNYVNLMRIRLPESVDVQFKTELANPDVEIAPMLFISLVENAIKHGVSPSEPSFIHVSIEGTEDLVICDIRNSNHPKTASDHSGHGIGLSQVQRRLDLSYPERYQWEYGPTNDGAYHSRIVIDLKKEKQYISNS
jgi:sensor histidine kinase YesM